VQGEIAEDERIAQECPGGPDKLLRRGAADELVQDAAELDLGHDIPSVSWQIYHKNSKIVHIMEK